MESIPPPAVFCAVAAAAVVTYLTALPNGFVSDARSLLPDNPSLLKSDEWLAWFGRPYYWGTDVASGFLYRPLSVLSYLVALRLLGASALPQVLANVILHAAASVLVLALGKRLLGWPAAWLGALLFAVHPLHTEVVAWVGGRPDLLAAVLAIGSAICFCRATERGADRPAIDAAVAVACYFAALLSKEHVITLPAWFGAVWLLERDRRSARWAGAALGGSVVALLLFLGLRAGALPSLQTSMEALTSDLGSPWAPWRWAAGLAVAGKFAAVFFWPDGLTFDYTLFPAMWAQSGRVHASELLLGSAVSLGFLIALAWAILKDRGLALCLAFIPITYAVVSGFPFSPQLYVAERFTYLPSAGACLAVGWVLVRIAERMPGVVGGRSGRVWVGLAAVVALVAPLAVRSAIRNVDWRTDETLARAALRVSMDSPLALRGVAQEELRAGNDEAARALLERSVRLDPRRSEPYTLLAQLYVKRGDVDGVVGLARAAGAQVPFRVGLIHYFGGLLWQLGRKDDAERLFRDVIAHEPSFVPSRLGLGGVLLESGRAPEALESFRAASTLAPGSPHAWYGLTLAALALGRPAEARAYADRGKAVGLKLPEPTARALERVGP